MTESAVDEPGTDELEDIEEDVTLFKGASNNTYFAVYFNALPEPGVDELDCEKLTIDLRPERDVTLYVEIYNPQAGIPLIVTPGGMGEIDGFGGFARNVAAAAPDLKVIIWDRRNMGRSGINFGSEPLSIEEAEDLHVLVERLGIAPAAFYGMSSGSRSNMVLAERYPEDIAALVIAPLTGGPLAAEQLPQEYYLKYLDDDRLTSMEAVAETPLWAAYVERNGPAGREELMRQDVSDFLAAMKRAGEHLRAGRFRHRCVLRQRCTGRRPRGRSKGAGGRSRRHRPRTVVTPMWALASHGQRDTHSDQLRASNCSTS